MTVWARWMRFNVVGVGGAVVQVLAIGLLVDRAGLHYAVATPAGIFLALVHNFCWHRVWTWRDRPLGPGATATAAAFMRFAGVNGLVALGSQTAVVTLLVERAGVPATISAAAAIVAASLASYGLAGALAFPTKPTADRYRRERDRPGQASPGPAARRGADRRTLPADGEPAARPLTAGS